MCECITNCRSSRWGSFNADDVAHRANTVAQTEPFLHRLEQAARAIILDVNDNKTTCFKRKRAISTQKGKSQKLAVQMEYIGSNFSSTESDVNIHLTKMSYDSDRLSILWKSDVSYKIK